jgi:divalent metal cation (Fe/Co/Zn/Cd) transporter
LTLATVSFALRAPTERFPLGYGKFESLGSLGVSSLLLVGGLLMGMSSALELCHIYLPAVADVLEAVGLGHSHSHSHQIPNIQAAWLAGASVLVKEWLYRASMWTFCVEVTAHHANKSDSYESREGTKVVCTRV